MQSQDVACKIGEELNCDQMNRRKEELTGRKGVRKGGKKEGGSGIGRRTDKPLELQRQELETRSSQQAVKRGIKQTLLRLPDCWSLEFRQPMRYFYS